MGLFARPDQPWRAPRRETALCGVALFVVLMAVWLLNSGHYTPLIIGFGVASSLLVVFLSWRMGIVDREGMPVHLLPRAAVYAPWLFKEICKANVDVAKRVLTPFMPPAKPTFSSRTRCTKRTSGGWCRLTAATLSSVLAQSMTMSSSGR